MKVQPYLFFGGRCEEALDFYAKALAAEVICVIRFKDNPEPNRSSTINAEKVMHSAFRIGDLELMATDGECLGGTKFQGISLSLTLQTKEETNRIFEALLGGGQVQMPLSETFFSPAFGMVEDRFGVAWMVMAEATVPTP